MRRWCSLAEVPADWGRSVVTIGVFDGVHLGHRQIIGRAVALARERRAAAVAVTFDPHPVEVIRPGTSVVRLTTEEQKASLLDSLGVDAVLTLRFDAAMQHQSPEDFIASVLVGALHAVAVVVGDNFRFGHRAAGDISTLRRVGDIAGFDAETLELLRVADTGVSSSVIRAAIAAGDVEFAAGLLGRDYQLTGTVVRGAGRGRTLLGYPTANMDVPPSAAVPADGVYAGWVGLPARGAELARHRAAAASVGSNPTFDGVRRTVEPYLLDFDEDIYGQMLTLEFTHRLRGMARFDSVDELIKTMTGDVAQTRALLL